MTASNVFPSLKGLPRSLKVIKALLIFKVCLFSVLLVLFSGAFLTASSEHCQPFFTGPVPHDADMATATRCGYAAGFIFGMTGIAQNNLPLLLEGKSDLEIVARIAVPFGLGVLFALLSINGINRSNKQRFFAGIMLDMVLLVKYAIPVLSIFSMVMYLISKPMRKHFGSKKTDNA